MAVVKIKQRHKRMDKLIHYLYGPGRANQHVNQRAVAASAGTDVAIGEMIPIEDVQQLVEQMRLNRMRYEFEGNDVWHMSLSIPKVDGVLSDGVWAKISRDAMEHMGFDGPGVSPCSWVAVRHGLSDKGNDHVHLAVSLVRDDGKIAKDSWSKKKMSTFARQVEQEYGLSVVDGRTAGASKGLSQHDLDHAERNGLVEPERETLGRKMRAGSTAATTEADYVARLSSVGVSVRPFVEDGLVAGYSVSLADSVEPMAFAASGVDKQLGLNRLRARMGWDPAESDVSVWVEPGDVSVLGVGLGDAELAVASVSERVAAMAGGSLFDDPVVLGGLAGDVSGVYAAVAERLEVRGPGPTARVSDTLARTSNIGSGSVGRSDELSMVSRVVLMSKLDGPSSLILLLERLNQLSKVVQEQHRVRGEIQRGDTLSSDQRGVYTAAKKVMDKKQVRDAAATAVSSGRSSRTGRGSEDYGVSPNDGSYVSPSRSSGDDLGR